MNANEILNQQPGGLFLTLHGSRLFGVHNPSSDHDTTSIHAPNRTDLLLGHTNALTPKQTQHDNTDELQAALEERFTRLEDAHARSVLPKTFDTQYAQQLILSLYT